MTKYQDEERYRRLLERIRNRAKKNFPHSRFNDEFYADILTEIIRHQEGQIRLVTRPIDQVIFEAGNAELDQWIKEAIDVVRPQYAAQAEIEKGQRSVVIGEEGETSVFDLLEAEEIQAAAEDRKRQLFPQLSAWQTSERPEDHLKFAVFLMHIGKNTLAGITLPKKLTENRRVGLKLPADIASVFKSRRDLEMALLQFDVRAQRDQIVPGDTLFVPRSAVDLLIYHPIQIKQAGACPSCSAIGRTLMLSKSDRQTELFVDRILAELATESGR